MKSPEALFAEYQATRDTVHSEAFDLGVLAQMRVWMDDARLPACPFAIATAESDAWHFGVSEGRQLVQREHLRSQNDPSEFEVIDLWYSPLR